MKTRFSKRAHGGVMEAKEGKEEVQVVDDAIANEGLQQDVDDVPVGPKRKKTVKHSPRKLLSPTGMLELAKLKEQTKMDRQKIEHLEDRIKYLEEANSELKNDKDFLLSQIKRAPSAPASTGKSGFRKTAHIPSSSSPSMSPSPSSSSSDFSSSSSSEEEQQKKKKKKKKEKKKSKKYTDSHSRSRMTTTDGIIRRYKNALKRFTKFGSMKKAFAKINVDRNTIARTAIIAELAITYPDTFQELLPTDEVNEKISEFAERCKRAMTKEMAETITAKKKS
ncbi:coiled-coil domain-containing protein 106-like [Carassius carassius]|uniref:coiled-coil domain-containing protein 106-like n=1 Tax=Carassius carassius TaxID=217509 RepID=UPI002868CC15|nr:coiled-coil domain-containing protein 106-like [Carassius carassius]